MLDARVAAQRFEDRLDRLGHDSKDRIWYRELGGEDALGEDSDAIMVLLAQPAHGGLGIARVRVLGDRLALHDVGLLLREGGLDLEALQRPEGPQHLFHDNRVVFVVVAPTTSDLAEGNRRRGPLRTISDEGRELLLRDAAG